MASSVSFLVYKLRSRLFWLPRLGGLNLKALLKLTVSFGVETFCLNKTSYLLAGLRLRLLIINKFVYLRGVHSPCGWVDRFSLFRKVLDCLQETYR